MKEPLHGAFVSRLRPMLDAARAIGRARERGADTATALDDATRRLRRAGWGGIVVFLGGITAWAMTTRLDAAAVAEGTVAVESNRKNIQHLEGGIVRTIHVEEGERVRAGQLLVTLDETGARAALDLLEGQMDATLALQARLRAERDGLDAIPFPDTIMSRRDDPAIRALIRTQQDVLESRRAWLADQEDLNKRTRIGEERKIEGYKRQIEANRRELALLDEEIAQQSEAVRKGVIARATHLALQRKAAAVSAEIAQNEARLEETRKALSEARSQRRLPATQNRNEVTEKLQDVEERLAGLREKVLAERDVLARTRVRAPRDGIIVDMQVHTAGGVVHPGERLMDLVPDGDTLIVDARIAPKDMAAVYKGMPARVMVTAFNPRTTPAFEGRVVSVSADRIEDPATGRAYFSARVAPEKGGGWLDRDAARLMPGMTAQVFLVKEPRTVLDYMLEPLLRAATAAGRES
jgi:HlyD family type I secretion membrane fusion protein